ncbi:MAG: DUF6463 family protein [Rhodoferax sp.]|uniref:DUF6463 family protein n=1 Tax=Rhodoferax sp. TaxID=50421 RepID=UPI00261E8FAD|nr:DUF6463 family protein [Rhodoferax sp.]MDD5336572.1 DUF6463 family protein [Rhodoferax sp.]
MSKNLSWMIFALGVGHILYGLISFRAPLAAALSDGLFDQFKAHPGRIAAFWFLAFGPLLMLAGQLCLHAVAGGDQATVRLIARYLLGLALVGVLAFPRSPFLAVLPIAALLLAQGYGLLS